MIGLIHFSVVIYYRGEDAKRLIKQENKQLPNWMSNIYSKDYNTMKKPSNIC